jgi:hypothetical protein
MDPGITRRGLEFLDEVEAQHALVPVRADPHVPPRAIPREVPNGGSGASSAPMARDRA